MSNKSSSSSQIISLPKGGGALHGTGEKFSPDLHTGTGNFTVPIALPPGRNGFQPQLNLVYSTGNGNGPFGLGWSLSIPGVSRKTSRGIPRYDDSEDTFILSGAEDLVPVPGEPVAATRYRPRTEGLFARIDRYHDAHNDYWEVRSKDGLVSLYGTPGTAGRDPAVIADPLDRAKVFAWKLTQTLDPFGNRIEYEYERDSDEDGPHHWDQLYLKQIRYADYTDQGQTKYLLSVTFTYEDRPDPFSEYRPGFEIRTTKRCRLIEVKTHSDIDRLARIYDLVYLDKRDGGENLGQLLPLNGVSLLSQIKVKGRDGDNTEELPPLEFGYTRFEPERRDFTAIQGADLPARSLANPDLELVDLFGNGLPDILEMNGTVRYWRNLGRSAFDLPREMRDAPAGLMLAEPGVQLIDADGDGRTDLLVTKNGLSGYFPLRFGGLWDRRSFQRYKAAPSFDLKDPEVRLLDLDGDGVTDAIRSGTRLECFFNDPKEGWNGTRFVERRALKDFPNVNFSDPRVKWADMTGDGLQDIVLVYDGNIEYWPNLGYGRWARRVSMRSSPRFPYGYDPKRILVGDVDGDGLADLLYVDDTKVTLWISQSGNRWSDPIEIQGTPPVSDMDAVRLADMLGTGVSGVLWSRDAGAPGRETMFFLDFTGSVKPYLLNEMDNHMGAVTRVEYAPSTRFYLKDEKQPGTRWKTPLPFPVQVVARVEVIDVISSGKLTTEYRYHHGYWDGAEREFRGFGMVEQLDTESFKEYHDTGLHGEEASLATVKEIHFSPPTLTKTWFHQGPIGEEFGDWQEQDWSDEYWQGDPQILKHTESLNAFLKEIADRRVKRDALRTLRGSILRTELYALDGTDRQDRPYTVTEHAYGLREEEPPAEGKKDRPHIFFPHALAQRMTQWQRGNDPMTQFSFTEDYDAFGQPQKQTQIAYPRGWRKMSDTPSDPYQATRSRTVYAQPLDPRVYIHDRVAKTTTYEIKNNGSQTVLALKNMLDSDPALSIIGQTLNFYDGPAFQGLPFGQLGDYGALVRTESLVLTEEILHEAYKSGSTVLTPPEKPPYLASDGPPAWTAEYPQGFRNLLPALAGYSYQPGGAGSEYETGYFAITERRRYDFHDDPNGKGRGLIKVKRDPLGRDTSIAYDIYDLLPTQVTDGVGLITKATYDYRVLQPKEVTDPNGNRAAFAFTPLGLLESTAVMGKTSENLGDTPAAPSTRLAYDFMAFADRGQPISVRTVRRVHHVNDTGVPLPERDETIETIEYSDGFGRLLQTRTQAEDVTFGDLVFGGAVLPVDQNDQAGTQQDVVGQRNTDPRKPNVVVSGWQIYDNKGRVVEKYEPFFSKGWEYAKPSEAQLGQKATMFYDPRGQVICTVNPDDSEQRVIYGKPADLTKPEQFTPSPWETYTYDTNDNAGRTHARDSSSYRHHWNTPNSALVDALGRTIETVERNGPNALTDWFKTRSAYDVRGNLLTVTDPLGRVAFKHLYDLANRPLRIENFDAGVRRIVLDAAGNEVERRDSKGPLILHAYDDLNRPIRLWGRDDINGTVTIRERLQYGDGSDKNQPAAERDANRLANRLGKLYRHYDEAGLMASDAYDFKGNLREKKRQVIRDDIILSPAGLPMNWADPIPDVLERTAYATSTTYDALNRVKEMKYPQDVDGGRKVLLPHYNRAGALESVKLDGTTYVERIAYNAKGQRTFIAYGNRLMTRYAYDSKTFRLVRMRTEGYTKPTPLTYHPTGALLQDFAYNYDLAGNILNIKDITPGCGVINSAFGSDALGRTFAYDPLYRLISATGREDKDIPKPRPWTDDSRQGFNSGNHGAPNQDNAPNLTALYREEYAYDPAGNMLSLKHRNNGNPWTRHFGMGGLTPQQWNQEWPNHLNARSEWANPPGNRLTHVGDDSTTIPQTHFFDANGNLIRENTERHFEWDYSDRMRVFRNQTAGAEPTKHAHYLYDAGGQRVKKLVRKQGGEYEVTVYVDGVFEYHRLVEPSRTIENSTLHVMDNQSRIALVRVGNPFPDDASPAVKYHLGDHLGSSSVVIDDSGAWINREEYFPYGETSFGSFARKRYRFTGKERDEESGLYYHGARYYAPWLARWVNCDPAGMVDGINLYEYVRCNPLRLIDDSGNQSAGLEEKEKAAIFRKEVLVGSKGPSRDYGTLLSGPGEPVGEGLGPPWGGTWASSLRFDPFAPSTQNVPPDYPTIGPLTRETMPSSRHTPTSIEQARMEGRYAELWRLDPLEALEIQRRDLAEIERREAEWRASLGLSLRELSPGSRAALITEVERTPKLRGYIYLRVNEARGTYYLGQALGHHNLLARIKLENRRLGYSHTFLVLEEQETMMRFSSGRTSLDVAEESMIRIFGGSQRFGGYAENARWQIESEAEYREGGGRVPRSLPPRPLLGPPPTRILRRGK